MQSSNFLIVSSCIITWWFLSKLTSFGFDQSPKQGCDILKGVFQMISVTEGKVLKHFCKSDNV